MASAERPRRRVGRTTYTVDFETIVIVSIGVFVLLRMLALTMLLLGPALHRLVCQLDTAARLPLVPAAFFTVLLQAIAWEQHRYAVLLWAGVGGGLLLGLASMIPVIACQPPPGGEPHALCVTTGVWLSPILTIAGVGLHFTARRRSPSRRPQRIVRRS